MPPFLHLLQCIWSAGKGLANVVVSMCSSIIVALPKKSKDLGGQLLVCAAGSFIILFSDFLEGKNPRGQIILHRPPVISLEKPEQVGQTWF